MEPVTGVPVQVPLKQMETILFKLLNTSAFTLPGTVSSILHVFTRFYLVLHMTEAKQLG